MTTGWEFIEPKKTAGRRKICARYAFLVCETPQIQSTVLNIYTGLSNRERTLTRKYKVICHSPQRAREVLRIIHGEKRRIAELKKDFADYGGGMNDVPDEMDQFLPEPDLLDSRNQPFPGLFRRERFSICPTALSYYGGGRIGEERCYESTWS